MSKRAKSHAPRKSNRNELVPFERPKPGPFLSFRHSHMEVTSIEGAARVKARHTRFEDGRLTSETFEGSLPASAYDSLVEEAQKSFASQTAFLLEQLSLFLPSPKRPSGSDK